MTLFINCCARAASRTKRLADALLSKLGEYEELELYKEQLLPLDEKSLEHRDALIAAGKLSDDIFFHARQFASADTIVIAAPYWDLSFPAELKIYIENIYVTGITSTYDENGIPKGLCKAQRLYYVTTAGGPYDPSYSFDCIRDLAVNFFGIHKAELIKADMLDISGNDPEEILAMAINSIEI